MVSQLTTDFRRDVEDLFRLWLPERASSHYPFLVVEACETGFRINTVQDQRRLLDYPDSTLVFLQWQGYFRSDFFEFTVGQYRSFTEPKRKAEEKRLLSARNVIKTLGPQGGFRSLDYEYTTEEGYTTHTGTPFADVAKEKETFFKEHGIPVTIRYLERTRPSREKERDW